MKLIEEMQRGRRAAEEAHAHERGFTDARSFRDALRRARLPCGHPRPSERAGKCYASHSLTRRCDQVYGEFRADTEEGRAALALLAAEASPEAPQPAPLQRPRSTLPPPREWRVCAHCRKSVPPEPDGAHGWYHNDGFDLTWYCKSCWAEYEGGA